MKKRIEHHGDVWRVLSARRLPTGEYKCELESTTRSSARPGRRSPLRISARLPAEVVE